MKSRCRLKVRLISALGSEWERAESVFQSIRHQAQLLFALSLGEGRGFRNLTESQACGSSFIKARLISVTHSAAISHTPIAMLPQKPFCN